LHMEPTDIQLMLRARDGDAAAFQQLMGRHRESLHRFFSALLADRSQADDFVQETFLRLWLSRRRYKPTGRFSNYLLQIGKHFWLNQRHRVRFTTACRRSVEEAIEIVAPPAMQPENIVLERQRAERIRRAIAALPAHYRAVFEMSHFEGRKYA